MDPPSIPLSKECVLDGEAFTNPEEYFIDEYGDGCRYAEYPNPDNYNGILHNRLGIFFGRLIFDNICNITLILIIVNMIAGIIIDTFRALNVKSAFMKDDE